jgi:hypothetical protein
MCKANLNYSKLQLFIITVNRLKITNKGKPMTIVIPQDILEAAETTEKTF